MEPDAKANRREDQPGAEVASSYSGQLRVRMPRSLHERLAARARLEGVSLNTLIVSLLSEGIGAGDDPKNRS